MRSRIFQVSSEPIQEEDLINEFRYEDNLVNGIADGEKPLVRSLARSLKA